MSGIALSIFQTVVALAYDQQCPHPLDDTYHYSRVAEYYPRSTLRYLAERMSLAPLIADTQPATSHPRLSYAKRSYH